MVDSEEDILSPATATGDGLVALEMLLLGLDEREPVGVELVANLQRQVVTLASRFAGQDDLEPLFALLALVLERVRQQEKIERPHIELLLTVTDFLNARLSGAPVADQALPSLCEALENWLGPTPVPQVLAEVPMVRQEDQGGALRLAFQREGADHFSRTLGQLLAFGHRLHDRRPGTALPADPLTRDDWDRFQGTVAELDRWALAQRKIPGHELALRIQHLAAEVAQRHGRELNLECQDRGVAWDPEAVDPLLQALEIWFEFLLENMESDQERQAAGKPATAQWLLWAVEAAGGQVMRIKDDGGGLDRGRLYQRAIELGLVEEDRPGERDYGALIFDRRWRFVPSSRAAERLTELRRILHALGGRVALASRPGKGILCEMRFPPTHPIFEGVEAVSGADRVVVPLFDLQETQAFGPHDWQDQRLMVRGRLCQAYALSTLMGRKNDVEVRSGVALVVEHEGRTVAVTAQSVQSPCSYYLQKLEQHHQRVFGLLGATVTADDAVLQVLNFSELLEVRW